MYVNSRLFNFHSCLFRICIRVDTLALLTSDDNAVADRQTQALISHIATLATTHFSNPRPFNSPLETQAGIRHGKKAISGHMLRHENFRLSANVLQLPEGDY